MLQIYKIQVDKMALIWQLKLIQLLSDITYMLSEYIWKVYFSKEMGKNTI